MTSPLNPALYNRLREEFGKVNISQEGMAAAKRYGRGLFHSDNRVKLEIDSAGEYYRVNCPYCGDSRGRLWINHLYGVEDDVTNSRNLWLAICYNEDCLSTSGRPQELYERVYGFKNAKLRGQKPIINKGTVEDEALKLVKPPGLLLPLDQIQINDKVINYIRDRNWSVEELQTTYNVSYVLNAESDFYMAQDRLFIPVIMNSILVGWQCRYPADLDWKTARMPKYYNRPNMPRRLMLYNFDQAKKFPFVVVCEGPTDVWNVGPYSVAAFGKHISAQQIKLLCDVWAGGAVVILLDGDAWADTEKLAERLKVAEYKGAIIPVRLPENKDPGSLDQALNNEFIIEAALSRGVDLLNIRKEDNASITRFGEGPALFNSVDGIRRKFNSAERVADYSFDLPRDAAART